MLRRVCTDGGNGAAGLVQVSGPALKLMTSLCCQSMLSTAGALRFCAMLSHLLKSLCTAWRSSPKLLPLL